MMTQLYDNQTVYNKLTMGVMKALEKRPGVCDIKLEEQPPADRPAVVAWEQKHSCILPDDIRNFYLSSNGLSFHWGVKMNDSRIPVGRLIINPIEKFIRIGTPGAANQDSSIPSLLDIDMDFGRTDPESESKEPRFDHRSRIFELDDCDGMGKVCYVFSNTKPGIPAQKADVWFLDRSLQWHHLASNFLTYYRMLVMHLGLPQWQYAFTDIGLSPQAQQWFNMYCPVHLGADGEIYEAPNHLSASGQQQTTFDISRVFKGRLDKKKATNPGQMNKRKQALPPPKPGSGRPLLTTQPQSKTR